jgi:hypothetical protein
MLHQLISLMDMPTLPVSFTSRLQGFGQHGCLLSNDEYYIVFEMRPLTVLEMMAVTTKSPVPNVPIQYLYTASVFYRKSRNPHGPSSRPIYVFCLEYTEFTCEMKSRGLFGALTGERREPAEVYFAVFFANGRTNMGQIPNNFTDYSAKNFLVEKVCEKLGLNRYVFREVGPLSLGPDCPAIA